MGRIVYEIPCYNLILLSLGFNHNQEQIRILTSLNFFNDVLTSIPCLLLYASASVTAPALAGSALLMNHIHVYYYKVGFGPICV